MVPPWPPPSGAPVGTTGWFLADDGAWYRSDDAPAPGYRLGDSGRWEPDDDPATAWRSSRWGLGDAWWGALVYLVSSIALSLLAVLIVAARQDVDVADVELGAYTISVLTLGNVLAFVGIPWLATRRKGLRSLRWDFGLRFRWVDLAIGLGMGFAGSLTAAVVTTAIDAALGIDDPEGNIPLESIEGVGPIIAFAIAVALITPIIEELFFRGLLYRCHLKRGRSVWASIAITTAAFVVPHLPAAESWAGLVSLAAAIAVLGATFNLACHLTGNRLTAPIAAHAVVNGIAVVAFVLS